MQVDVPKTKKEHFKAIIDEENLEAPQDSVEFLQYLKKHQKKVEHHKQRVHTFSKGMMFLGIGALAYVAYCFMFQSQHQQHHRYSGKHHRLGASMDESQAMGQTFSALSVAIWGMVVSKAKSGLEAAGKNDSNSVGGLVKKIGTLCALIGVASVFQLMGTMNTANPVEAVQQATASSTHKLQASHAEKHPASYYDSSSSHYMGGAHNVLLNQALKGDAPKKVASQKAMGGAHNVAMAVLAEKSNEYKRKQQVAASRNRSMFAGFGSAQVSEEQFRANLRNTGAFVAFIGTLAVCIAFFVTVKTYHAQLEKHDKLVVLLKNPNARVASGKQGKEVVAKLMNKSKELKAKAEPVKKVAETRSESSIDALIAAAKAIKAKKAEEAQAEKLLSGYQPPKLLAAAAPQQTAVVQVQQPTYNYQLVEPVAEVKPVAIAPVPVPQPQQQYWYPNLEVSAPVPIPQTVTKVAVTQPEPAQKLDLASVPKQELIAALLKQISKE